MKNVKPPREFVVLFGSLVFWSLAGHSRKAAFKLPCASLRKAIPGWLVCFGTLVSVLPRIFIRHRANEIHCTSIHFMAPTSMALF